MVCKLALRYSCGNKTAKEDLIDAGISALHKFLLEHENELSEELFETKAFSISVYNYLWSKIGYEAQRMSHSSPVFSGFALKEKEKNRKKTEIDFYGDFNADTKTEAENCNEHFGSDIADGQNSSDMETIELMYDVSRILTEEEYALFLIYFNGTKVVDIAREFGITAGTVSKHLAKIRKKLISLGESLRA